MCVITRDKVQLTQEVGDYSKKLHQDYEDLDKLAIQADLWRSKFKASRCGTYMFLFHIGTFKTEQGFEILQL